MVKAASHAVNAKAAARKVCRVPKVIRFGSDFSGMDAAAFALDRLGARYVNKFASDVLPAPRKFLEVAHRPEKIFDDMLTRTIAEETEVDIYVWTPPCQDISAAGKQSGFKGKQQAGKLVARSLAFISRHKPRVTLFENVPRLLAQKHRSFFQGMLKTLKSLGYNVQHKLVSSADHGVPQTRERLFIVAIRADSQRYPFQWPSTSLPKPASAVLNPFDPKTDLPGRLPGNALGKRLVQNAMTSVFKTGIDPLKVPVFIDCDCSEKFATYGVDEARTITRARGGSGGPWVSSRGRKVTIDELFKLHGYDNPAAIPWQAAKLTKRQVGQMIGNSVCPPVIGMLLSEAMYAAGLTSKKLEWKAA